MTRAELVERVAREIREAPIRATIKGGNIIDADLPMTHADLLRATAALAAIEAAGLIPVERKLLSEAHACMRETGWHLASHPWAEGSEPESDGVLEAACVDIEARMAAVLLEVANANQG